MDSSGSYWKDWKEFETTGGVREYLNYKKALRTGQPGLPPPAGDEHATGDARPGAAGSEGGGI